MIETIEGQTSLWDDPRNIPNRRIGLVDVDGHNYPNLCLMKLSAYHKSLDDHVEWYRDDQKITYDIVYMSRVFNDEYSTDAPEPAAASRGRIHVPRLQFVSPVHGL